MRSSRLAGIGLIFGAILLAMLLAFIKASYDEQAAFLCETAHDSQLDMAECPAHKKDASWLITLSFGTAFLILAAGVHFFLVDRQTSSAEQKKDVGGLDRDEMAVYGMLKASGSLYQSDIVSRTGYSKVKVTRVIDRLESRGIVERRRRGMTNLVILK